MNYLTTALAGFIVGIILGGVASVAILGSVMVADLAAVSLTGSDQLFQWETFVRSTVTITLVMGFGFSAASVIAKAMDEGEEEDE